MYWNDSLWKYIAINTIELFWRGITSFLWDISYLMSTYLHSGNCSTSFSTNFSRCSLSRLWCNLGDKTLACHPGALSSIPVTSCDVRCERASATGFFIKVCSVSLVTHHSTIAPEQYVTAPWVMQWLWSHSATADLHTLQFTVTHALGFSVFTSRILATDLQQSHCHFKSHMKASFCRLISFLPFLLNHLGLLSPELDLILDNSSLRRPSLFLYNPSARITQKTAYRWEGMFTYPLPSNGRPTVARVGFRGNMCTKSLPSNGSIRHNILALASKYWRKPWKNWSG
jgi:hypothetical protein